MPRRVYFDSVSSILTRVIQRHGMETKILEFRLRRRWPELVGQQIAAHTRPDQIRFKKLYLSVRNSVWLQQLTFLKPVLLEKINGLAGVQTVNEIVLRIGDVDADMAPADPIPDLVHVTASAPPPGTIAEVASHTRTIKDPDLRRQLTSVMAQALSRHEDRRQDR